MSDILERLDRYAFHAECPFDKEAFEIAAAEITRLREELAAYRARKPVVYSPDAQAMSDRVKAAEAERDALREENARLLEALKPFAERADRWDGQPERQILVMLSECRAAAAAIREVEEASDRETPMRRSFSGEDDE